MTAGDLVVAGRRFRTHADYAAAMRDQEKIKAIRAKTDFNDPRQLYRLYSELQSGLYRFETVVGKDFDDTVYEEIEKLKKQGITARNAGGSLRGGGNVKSGKNNRLSSRRVGEPPGGMHSKERKNQSKGKRLEDYDKEMQQQILDELQKQERKRKLIIALASIVAVASFGYFGVYYFFSTRTNVEYEELASLKGSEVLSDNFSEADRLLVHRTSSDVPDILDEYKTLYAKNKKLIGWLKIDDTNIDYPVMQTSNNEYYLDHNYNQEYDKNGSLFLDRDCSIYPRSTNLIIYGHHMKSGNMFGNLQKYAKESYGKEHAIIQFDTIYEKAAYQVMYVFRSQVYNNDEAVFKYYQFIEANSENEFSYYMEEMSKISLYDTGVTASYGDSLITLSTCDNSQTDGRFVVVAKKIV